jgi:hypothetical protein
MVNVGIGTGESPDIRVFPEITFHVFVNLHLQVNPEFTVRPDDDIGTDAAVVGDIPSRVPNRIICGIIYYFLPGQDQSGIGQSMIETGLGGYMEALKYQY